MGVGNKGYFPDVTVVQVANTTVLIYKESLYFLPHSAMKPPI